MTRVFVAFELPDKVREDLARVAEKLLRTGAELRVVRPDAMHVTLKFLGEVDAAQIPAIRKALGRVELHEVQLRVEGLGHFPPRGRPRVIWAGLAGQVDLTTALATRIDDALADLGFAPESRAFHPHVTLGRVRSSRGLDDLLAESERLSASVRFPLPPIRDFVLFESRLEPTGARYHALWRSSIRGLDPSADEA